MSGTTSYNIGYIRHLDKDTSNFISAYTKLIVGDGLTRGEINSIYYMLTGINVSDINYNEEETILEIYNMLPNNNRLLSLLQDATIRHKISLTRQYNILLKIIRSKGKDLPNIIIRDIIMYMMSMSNETISEDMINDKFKTSDLSDTLDEMKSLMYDQIGHFQSNEVDCHIWHIDCSHNNFELGSICAFYNSNSPIILDNQVSIDSSAFLQKFKFGLMIQDIVKYPIPYLVQSLFPNYMIPKLNSVLDIPIDIVADSIGVSIIFVRPVGNQGNILEKYYGYTKTDVKLNYPCETISIGFGPWYYKEVNKST